MTDQLPTRPGWYRRDGDPAGVLRWHSGTAWSERLNSPPPAGSTAQAADDRLDRFRSDPTREPTPPHGRIPERIVAGAVLVLVGATFDLYAGGVLLAGTSVLGGFVPLAMVLLCVGALALWAGTGVLRLNGTALTTALVLAFVGTVLGVMSLVRGDGSSAIGVGVNVTVLLLLAGPQVRRSFG